MSVIVSELVQNYNPYDDTNRTLETAWDYVQSQVSCHTRADEVGSGQVSQQGCERVSLCCRGSGGVRCYKLTVILNHIHVDSHKCIYTFITVTV